MILDTNALSAYADGDRALFALLAPARQLALPVVVLGEYRSGIAQSRNREKYQLWLESLIAECSILDITRETSLHYADVVLALKKIGKPIPTNDLWIAALCRQHDRPLVSRDRHFDVVPALRRIEW